MKKIRMILTIWFITSLGISTLGASQLIRIEREDPGGGTSAYILNTSYDEVWDKVLDVLLYEKFKIRKLQASVHSILIVDMDKGLIVIKGSTGPINYTLKCTLHKKDCNVLVTCRCAGLYKPSIIEKVFQLFEKKFNSFSE